MSVWRAREAKRITTYGSARWAEMREVRRAGLLGRDGVVLGRWRERYLRHDGPEHVLCFAPTRSGKGVGLVIPTLLTWPDSAIVHDIKGENWTLTTAWRARFGLSVLENLKGSWHEIEARHGVRPEVRIGINARPAVIGHLQAGGDAGATVLGDTVNVAARRQAFAEPGTALCSWPAPR